MPSYLDLSFWDGESVNMRSGDIHVADGLFSERSSDSSQSRSLKGLYAIPGLIDAHIHLCLNPEIRDPLKQTDPTVEQRLEEMRERALGMLKAGITSARDLGGGQHLELQVRDEIEQGAIPGPRLICAGQPITSVGGHCHFWGGEAADQSVAMDVLERQHQAGVDLIKIMVTGGNITPGSRPVDSQFDDETIAALVKAAGDRNYHVAAHCHGTDGIRQAAFAGVRTVEHCSWVGEQGWGRDYDQAIVDQIVEGDVRVSPTINSGWKRFQQKEFVEMVQGNYRQMKKTGVKLIASTDAGIPNVFHDDLPRALPQFARFAGLTPIEVLRSATVDCAEAIGLGHLTGSIKPGLSADFVVYEESPLENLDVLTSPVMVIKAGVEIFPG